MEKSLGVNGLTHPCYVFYQRMNFCINKESFYTRMCLEEIEDWVECKSRTKHKAFFNFIQREMKKLRIYELPQYDEHNDVFVNISPSELQDADSYFTKDKKELKQVNI